MSNNTFSQEAFLAFIDKLNTIVSGTGIRKIEWKGGDKYVRVIAADNNGSSRSAYCFVDRQTGDIYKPKSWASPIKNFTRGNINDADITKWCGPYGIHNAK